MRITKTNTPGVNGNVDQTGDTVVSGSNTTYTIVATNDAITIDGNAQTFDPTQDVEITVVFMRDSPIMPIVRALVDEFRRTKDGWKICRIGFERLS